MGVCAGLGALGCGDAQLDPTYGGEPLLTINGRVEAPLSVGDVEVGILWLSPVGEAIDAAVECVVEFSGEAPSACVASCGVPSCDDVVALEAWLACTAPCEGPDGVSTITIDYYAERLFDGAVGQTTPVEGEFPAQFRLDLLELPPEEVVGPSSMGERLAVGLFIALDPGGAPFEFDLDAPPSFPTWLLGGAGSHLSFFTAEGVPSDSQWGTLLGFGLSPGFHLTAIVNEALVNEDGEADENTAFVPASDGRWT